MMMWAAGTGLVLITLSGETLQKAMYISLAALAVNVVAIALGDGVEEQEMPAEKGTHSAGTAVS